MTKTQKTQSPRPIIQTCHLACPVTQDGVQCMVLPYDQMADLMEHLLSNEHLFALQGTVVQSQTEIVRTPEGGAHEDRRYQGEKAAKLAAPSAHEVGQLVEQLGRKFEVTDINGRLVEFATTWALAYEGDFEYMVDMKAAASKARGLSDGMAKGVLNCWRADYFRSAKLAKQARSDAVAPFLVEADYEHGRVYATADGTFVKVQQNQAGTQWYGKSWDNEDGWVYGGRPLLAKIARNLSAEEAAAWGHEHHRCVFCRRKLSNDGPARSVEVGYGPTCADKYGLPWG